MPAERLTSYHPNIRVEREGHVTEVMIDRPASKNGCTGDMWVALGAAFREVSYSGARAVVLTGAGGNFCTGADLGGTRDRGNAAATPASGNNLDGMRVLADVVLAIHGCPVSIGSESLQRHQKLIVYWTLLVPRLALEWSGFQSSRRVLGRVA